MILLPMLQDRRMILNELETLRDSLQSYKDNFKPITRPLYGTFFDKQTQSWLFPKDASEELNTRSFFKRFLPSELEMFLTKMTVKQHKMGSVIFPDE